MDKVIVQNILNDVPIDLFISMFTKELRMERLPLFLMTIKDVNNEFAKNFVERIDISLLSEKLAEEKLWYINSIFLPLYNIDPNIASKLARELLREENLNMFLKKIENEERMFFVSFFIQYISLGNIELAKKVVDSIDINVLIKKFNSPEDIDFLVHYLLIISLLMGEIASKKFKKIDIKAFRRFVMAKLLDRDLFSVNRLLLCIAIADKRLASESLADTNLNLINNYLKNEELRNIWFYILCLAFINKNVARRAIKILSIHLIIQKFECADNVYSILDFIDTIAYIDCEMAVNLYIMTIAYAKITIAQELISAIGLDERILDINAYLFSYFETSALMTDRYNKIIDYWGYLLIKESLCGWTLNLRKDDDKKR